MSTRRWAMGGGGGFAIQDREVLGHSSRLDFMGTICQDLRYIPEIPLFLFTRWPTLRHLLFLDLLMFAHVAGRIHIADLYSAPCKISFITVRLSLDLILSLPLMPRLFS